MSRLITEGQLKLQFFYTGHTGNTDVLQCVHTFPFKSRAAMARETGITEARLKGAGKGTPDNFSDETIQQLADYFGFDADWPEWRTGTVREFAERYNRESTYQSCSSSSLPTSATRNVLVPLEEDKDATHESFATRLSSICLYTSPQADQESLPGQAFFGIYLNCSEKIEDDCVQGLKRVFVEFDLGTARMPPLPEWPGYPAGVEYNNAKFSPANVNLNRPSFVVDSLDGKVIGLVGEVPPWFIKISNLAPGVPLRVSLKAYPMDIETSLVLKGKPHPTQTEEKMAQWLKKLSLAANDEGEVELANSGISFKLKEADSERNDDS